ncbi:MAG: hypothetical protein SFX18_18435 [Pirellulales bacterium]|nr:hypothetical protein [Pirellulales bacterium]
MIAGPRHTKAKNFSPGCLLKSAVGNPARQQPSRACWRAFFPASTRAAALVPFLPGNYHFADFPYSPPATPHTVWSAGHMAPRAVGGLMLSHFFRHSPQLTITGIVLWAIAWGLPVSSQLAAAEFPYVAYVSQNQAFAHSGPGTAGEYRTERLDRGQRVLVFKMAQGWCAIRPPRGAYSWVEGRFVELVSEDLGQVRVNQAPCYIGSQVLERRDRLQVELKEGESVEILESVETPGGLWYKIAPPAGEFRWMQASDLSRDPPAEESKYPPLGTSFADKSAPVYAPPDRAAPPDASAAPPQYTPNANPEMPAESAPGALAPVRSVQPAVVRAPWPENTESTATNRSTANHSPGDSSPSGLSASIPPVGTAPAKNSPGGWQSPDWSKLGNGVSVATPNASTSAYPQPGGNFNPAVVRPVPNNASQANPSATERQFAAELASLEQDLAAMLTEDPAAWSFASLNKRADKLLDQAQSALDRGKIRLLQNKLSRFEEIKQRALNQQALTALTPPPHVQGTPPSVSNALPNVPNISAHPAPTNVATGGEYDGIGKLMPVLAKRPNAPKFALVNGRNQVVAFVTPADDLNLQAWVGQYVGIHGERGFMPELKATHIQATTVSPVDPGGLAQQGNVPTRR